MLCCKTGLANPVGYSTQEAIGGKLACVGLQFGDVAAEDVTTIASISLSGVSAGNYDTMETEAPCVMEFDGSTYIYYYYISDAFDADGNEVTAWADAGGDVASAEKMLGTGLWLRIPEDKSTNGTLTESGAVNGADSTTIDIANGLTLASNPYPIAMNLSKVTTSGLVAGGYDTMETDAPCVMVFDGLTYTYYYYITDAFDADGNEVTAWADAGGDAVTDDIAAVGQAVWIRSSSSGSMTFGK